VNRATVDAQRVRNLRGRLALGAQQQHSGALGRVRAVRRAHHPLQHPTLRFTQAHAVG